MLKVMLSVILFLVVAILFKHPSDQLADVRHFVIDSFEREFQFAVVSNWYEQQFGKPLALFPVNEQESNDERRNGATVNQQDDYAVPASGHMRILESFESNGKGIMIETAPESVIESVKDGYVVFMGEREDIGKTVIIQHDDGSESWYGHLQEIDVALYDYIKSGDPVGKASNDDSGETGIFYFALKKEDTFIDPIQVISFD